MPPWTGYLAFDENRCVGTCAFKAPPQGNCVEIAYFTFPEYEGKGIATRMAQALVKIALEAEPEIKITANPFPKKAHQLECSRSLVSSSRESVNILKTARFGNGS